GARRDVLGVAGLGDVGGHVRPPGRLAPLGDDDEDVRAVGRQLQVRRGLMFGELVFRQRRRLVLLLLALPLLGLRSRVLDQRLLFGLDELLAVGLARVALLRRDV